MSSADTHGVAAACVQTTVEYDELPPPPPPPPVTGPEGDELEDPCITGAQLGRATERDGDITQIVTVLFDPVDVPSCAA